MKQKQTIESVLTCKATAKLLESINNDMLKTDGNLKELLDDRPSQDEQNSSNRSTIDQHK